MIAAEGRGCQSSSLISPALEQLQDLPAAAHTTAMSVITSLHP
jgi:hypothetical protein